MSAALTSSTFVGAKVSVAKTTTASKRVAFSVQANASGPKKVRIPISFFFCALKKSSSSLVSGGWWCVQILHFVQLETWDCARFFSETSMKRSCASFGNDRCACIPMRKFTPNAITRVSGRLNLRVAVRPRATDFEFYFIFFVCLFDTLRLVRRLIEDRFYSKKPSKRQRNLFCLFLEGKNEK